MEQKIYFEQYEINNLRTTYGRTISEADIVFHAGHTGDFFPHHMDEVFCAQQDFKKRIAHGTMTFSIGIGLTATLLNPVAMTYGYDKLRFPCPVFIGDTIHTEVEIMSKRVHDKRPGYGFVVEACRVINQDKKVVLYCEHILLVEIEEMNNDTI
ncbi:MAG: dehydratase [Rhizobiales bacterium]|nr:dehydratase [Hyphomicrobiales bacterium]